MAELSRAAAALRHRNNELSTRRDRFNHAFAQRLTSIATSGDEGGSGQGREQALNADTHSLNTKRKRVRINASARVGRYTHAPILSWVLENYFVIGASVSKRLDGQGVLAPPTSCE